MDRMTPLQKARALVECGECETIGEAAGFLLDMGEITERQAERIQQRAGAA